MGYLTTITIYNDGIHLILEDSEGFCRKLYDAATAMNKAHEFGHGNHANLVKVQRPRYADDHTIYVHMGNTVCEMNLYSKETEKLIKSHPKFFKQMLDFMKEQTAGLEKKTSRKKIKTRV